MSFIPGTPIYEPSAQGSSMWEMLIPAGINMFGNMLNAGAQNRATKEQNQIQREALQLNREQDRRSAESDIFRKLAQMSYLKSGGAQEGPTTIKYGGVDTTLPSYGFGPRAASQTQMDAAGEMEKLLMERLRSRVTPMTMPPAVSGAQGALRMINGNDDAAKKLEEWIRSRTTTPGY